MRPSIAVIVVFLIATASYAADKPNVVFMIADDCTFRDIGCYGGQASTPNLDKLAGQGMRFTRCFQSAPMCSPTRHNIYTGIYPVKSGAYPNHTHVNPGIDSIVKYMSDLGYRVAQSGKQHVAPESVFSWQRLGNGNNPEFPAVDAFLGECEKQRQPFCLLLCSNEPHTPWNKGDPSQYPVDAIQLPPYFVDTPETRDAMSRYLAEITYFDNQVGDAVKLLDDHGFTDNTLLVVVSEQGSSLPFAKWTCYDNGLQSACIVRWPGKVQPASVNPAMIEYVDLLPTFIEAGGGTPGDALDGKSLLPVFAGKTTHKQYVFGEMTTRGIINGSDHFGIRSVRSDKYKYIWNFTPETPFRNACVSSNEFQSWLALAQTGDPKARELTQRYVNRPAIELYDVENDPLEMNNLADDPAFNEVKTQLRAELDRWMTACGDRGQATEMDALRHTAKGDPDAPRGGKQKANKKKRKQNSKPKQAV